jgi:hypothetical protein
MMMNELAGQSVNVAAAEDFFGGDVASTPSKIMTDVAT